MKQMGGCGLDLSDQELDQWRDVLNTGMNICAL